MPENHMQVIFGKITHNEKRNDGSARIQYKLGITNCSIFYKVMCFHQYCTINWSTKIMPQFQNYIPLNLRAT